MRNFGAIMSIEEFSKLWLRQDGSEKRPKTPKALDDAFRAGGEGGAAAIAAELAVWDAEDTQALEQELFKQARRLADAERVLASARPTKKAGNDQRIATTKIEQIKGRIADLQRTEPKARDYRIFPGYYAPVIISEGGQRVIKPMRYQCRPAGKSPIYDTKYPGTYNARRDSLQGFWREQFGYTHGVLVVGRFYENVEGPDGKNRVVQFQPSDREPMLVACLWSRWTDPAGEQPDLLSFAAITDEPEPEVAAVGHDRTIINIRSEHVDAWLNPDPANFRRCRRFSTTSGTRSTSTVWRLDRPETTTRIANHAITICTSRRTPTLPGAECQCSRGHYAARST